MKVAIDVDGVLADHVPAVLSKLRTENPEFAMTKEDVQSWDEELPTIGSDMKVEIERAESTSNFVKSIPPIKGAVQATNQIADDGHDIIIVTNRPESILPATHEWLEYHGIPHRREESLSTNGMSKSVADADILIDDFPANLREFMNVGLGILFIQPWNLSFIDEFRTDEQSFVADTWKDVQDILYKIQS
jgi:5'-nucleotidase